MNNKTELDDSLTFMLSVTEAVLADINAESGGTTLPETVTFGEILIQALEGAYVARKKWVDSDTKDVIYADISDPDKPQLKMRMNDGSVEKWLPKHKEIFAADWYVVHR